MRCAIAVAVGIGLLTLGCSQNAYLDANLELMNAERRALEDRLYSLKYEYEARVAELEQVREENESLRRQLPADEASTPPPESRDMEGGDPAISEEDLTVPRVVIPPLNNGAASSPRTSGVPVLAASERNPRISHVEIAPRSLQGVDFDDEPGDDGLAIVVEPRAESGELVRLAAPISVVVLDATLRGQGEKARVARWDLTETDVDRFLQDSPADEGIRLHLLWPEAPPQHAKLQVYVRYHTADGRRLDAGRGVRIRLGPRVSQRWTPRATN